MVLNRKMDIALIDYGQTKSLSEDKRLAFAGLVEAMARRSPGDVATGMKALGIVVEDVVDKKGSGAKKGKKRPTRRTGRAGVKAATSSMQEAREFVSGKLRSPGLPAFASEIVETPSSAALLQSESPGKLALAARPPSSRLTSAEKLAYTMFDTMEYEGVSSNPFGEESALRTATVSDLPKELFFLLRTMQIFRGICAASGNSDFSLAKSWAPIARATLREGPRG